MIHRNFCLHLHDRRVLLTLIMKTAGSPKSRYLSTKLCGFIPENITLKITVSYTAKNNWNCIWKQCDKENTCIQHSGRKGDWRTFMHLPVYEPMSLLKTSKHWNTFRCNNETRQNRNTRLNFQTLWTFRGIWF
jgi:hypothetical protein